MLTLSEYLKTKLDQEVTCRKIETTQSRFSSFCVTAECNDVAEIYDPQLWPAGSFVRCYYEPRHPREQTEARLHVRRMCLALERRGCCTVTVLGCRLFLWRRTG